MHKALTSMGRLLAFWEKNSSLIPVEMILICKITKFWWKQSKAENNLIACILSPLWDTQVQTNVVTST